jgi:hypothetical protein
VTPTTEYQGCSEYGSESSTAYDDYCAGTGLYPLFSRRPVVATADVVIGDSTYPVAVIANHFKSQIGGAPSDQRRLEQAQFVAGLVDDFAGANTIVLGDLNDFEDSPPLDALTTDGDLTNLWFTLPWEARFSYIFGGVSEVLDHLLVTPSLAGTLKHFAPLHTNADFPFYPYAYDEDVIWRTSDHDPIAGRFCVDSTPPVLEIELNHDSLWPPNHKVVTVHAKLDVYDDADPNPTATLVSVTSNEPDDGLGDGDEPNDIEIKNDTTFRLRAERSGTGDGRIYTITYEVTDACGNSALTTATVTVPHSQGEK